MTKFERLEAARLSRGAPDMTLAASHASPALRVAEVEPNGLRFRFTFPGERPTPKRPGFQGMSPEKRREVSAKANAARRRKLSKRPRKLSRWATRRSNGGCGRCGEPAVPRRSFCQSCLDRAAALEREHYRVGGRERQLAKRMAKRENG